MIFLTTMTFPHFHQEIVTYFIHSANMFFCLSLLLPLAQLCHRKSLLPKPPYPVGFSVDLLMEWEEGCGIKGFGKERSQGIPPHPLFCVSCSSIDYISSICSDGVRLPSHFSPYQITLLSLALGLLAVSWQLIMYEFYPIPRMVS